MKKFIVGAVLAGALSLAAAPAFAGFNFGYYCQHYASWAGSSWCN